MEVCQLSLIIFVAWRGEASMGNLKVQMTPEVEEIIQLVNSPKLLLMQQVARGEPAFNCNEPASKCSEMTTEDKQTTADCEQTAFDAGQTTTAGQWVTLRGREMSGIAGNHAEE